MIRFFLALLAMLASLLASAGAHESRPLFVEIEVKSGGEVFLTSIAPASVEAANAPAVRLSMPCEAIAEQRRGLSRLEAVYRCPELTGVSVTIDWPAFNPSLTTIVRATFENGEARTAILEPGETLWALPEPESFAGAARSYFFIGVEHIVFGIDHLLFLAGLLFISGTFRRAIVTATGFTIAHSLTLALVALDVLRVSIPAVEAVIALSIVFLAAEIARGNRQTIAWRRPALVASAFGLVHGAGFAAALSEIGLPASEKTAALLFFNLGVEAGQLGVILGVFALLAGARLAVRRDLADWNGARPLQLCGGYALGVVSATWFVERAAAVLGA